MNQDHPTSDQGTGQAYLLLAASFVLLFVVAVPLQMFAPRAGLVVTELLLILLPAVLFVWSKGLPIAQGLRLNRVSAFDVVLSIATGLTAWGVAIALHKISSLVLGKPLPVQGFEAESIGQWLLLLFIIAVLPGICEEILFRGAIQGVLERRGAIRAVVMTSVLFSVYHLDPWRLLSVFFIGIVLGTLVVRTGSIIPAILAHASCNAAAVTISYLFKDQPQVRDLLMWILAAAFVPCAAIVWQRVRHRSVAPSPLTAVPAQLSRWGAWLFAAAAVVASILMALIIAGIVYVVDLHTVESAELAPHLKPGDSVLVVRDLSGKLPIRAGDLVSYQIEETQPVSLGRVLRTEGDQVAIATPSDEIEIVRQQVLGKVIYPEPPSPPPR